jgi:hypothetical protein
LILPSHSRLGLPVVSSINISRLNHKTG